MSQELILRDAKLMARLDKLGRAAKRAHDRVRTHATKAVENMVRSGQSLCKARDLCDTEKWDQFLAKYFQRAERTAQTYMKLARNWPVLQAIAPPEALTSQRKALRLLNSLIVGEQPSSEAPAPQRKRRASRKTLELSAPAASTEAPASAYLADERRIALSRMYQKMLGVFAAVTKDLSAANPSNHLVRNALDAIRRAQNDFVASGQELFCSEVTTSEASATNSSTSVVVGQVEDNW